MSRKGLIIVDMLNDFIDKNGALYCGKRARAIIPFIRKRLYAYRKNKNLVIYIRDSHDKDDKEFEKFPAHCITGSWGGEIIPELTPESGEKIISKKRYSGFYGTDLEKVLKTAGVDKLEVVGVCTSICVMDTAGGLANRDYTVTIPVEGVADFDPEFHEFSLKRMEKIYGVNIV